MNSISISPVWRRRQRGAQIVEFAVVLPLLVFIAMGIMEAATFVRIHQVINNAAREGARVASTDRGISFVDSASSTNVLGIAAACKYLNDNKGTFPSWAGDASCGEPFEIKVEPFTVMVDGSAMYSTRATVRYRYTMKYMPFLAFLRYEGNNTLQLEGKAQFRNFYAPPAT